MTAGQAAFAVAADVAALDVLADRLAAQELDRGARHVAQLRTVLQMHALYRSAGMEIATRAHAVLALGCSEHRAGRLLTEGLALAELPGGLEAVEYGLLTVEQSSTVVQQLEPLPLPVRLQVWQRLQAQLLLHADRRAVLPPARLSTLLRRWIIEAEPADAVQRRHDAQAGRRLDYRRRADGLNDLFAYGLTGPDAHAVLSRIRARSHPVGPEDDRTAEQRRLDAFIDLLLGRDPLPLHDPHHDGAACGGGGRARCGCWPGASVPCGADVLVHLSLPTALGSSDEPAEQVGHGPLEPDLLTALLLAAPRLRAVWTDERGLPVAVSDRVVVPERGDPAALRQALLHLAAQPPPQVQHPRHPHDHPPDAATALPPAALGTRHPGGSGSYRVPRRLRRLIDVRSPRCEWPGCGARAIRCDAEHDLAWPTGPTCACNLGPCCRRHHRIKQHGWTKQRTAAGITWTSPGRAGRWFSPAQHQSPAPPVRLLPPLPADDPLAELSPLQRDEELWWLTDRPDDLQALELRALAADPTPRDHLRELLRTGDTSWNLDLDDPYRWLDESAATSS